METKMTTKSFPKVILLVDTSRISGRKLIRGIAMYARLHGPWLFNRQPMFNQYQENAKISQSETKLLSRLKKWGADGIIANNINHKEQFDKLSDMGLPMAIVGSYLPQKSNSRHLRIRSDSDAIGKLAAEHLLDRGYKNYAFCGYDFLNWSTARGESFAKRLAQNSIETYFYTQPKPLNKRRWVNEQFNMAEWLKSLPMPVGLMACNDDRAQQVIEACKIANLHVPEQVAIIGVDDDEFVCDLAEPPLSSIPLDNKKTGFETAMLLHKMMTRKEVSNKEIIVQPTHVVARQSTDILAIEDYDVAMALRYIRQNSKQIIQVEDVLKIVPIGRRTLEEKLKKVIGRSIYSEISRCRVNHICQVIIETNQPISQIAYDFGYTSAAHIARYFQRVKGMTPLEYRKRYGQH